MVATPPPGRCASCRRWINVTVPALRPGEGLCSALSDEIYSDSRSDSARVAFANGYAFVTLDKFGCVEWIKR